MPVVCGHCSLLLRLCSDVMLLRWGQGPLNFAYLWVVHELPSTRPLSDRHFLWFRPCCCKGEAVYVK